MVKIIFLTTSLNYGGAETQLFCLATRLKARGLNVMVVSMLPPVAYTEELKVAEILVETLGMRRGVPDPKALFRFAHIIRRERPQLVHSHMIHANLLARLVRLYCNMPVLISTAHSINEGGRWREIAYRVTDSLADLTTNVSRAAVSRYIQVGAVPRDKIMFMPNGIDTDRFKPERVAGLRLREEMGIMDNFVWLAVGRFEAAKDYPNMLRAFSVVAEERTDAVLLLIGQGHLLEETKKLACDLGLKDRVCFLGVRRDIPELMNAADAYVMSSAWEGLPMVLLEAGACGLPIVATDVGGNGEVVLDKGNGYIVPPHDSEALAAVMCKMMALSDPERQTMGQAGRAHIVANYSLEHVVDQWESLYRELLRRKGTFD